MPLFSGCVLRDVPNIRNITPGVSAKSPSINTLYSPATTAANEINPPISVSITPPTIIAIILFRMLANTTSRPIFVTPLYFLSVILLCHKALSAVYLPELRLLYLARRVSRYVCKNYLVRTLVSRKLLAERHYLFLCAWVVWL